MRFALHYGHPVLSTLLVRMPWLAFSVLILALLLAPLVGAWLATKPRLTRALAVVAMVAVAALTLYPDGEPSATVTCAAELPYLSPTAVESTANILLFVPLAFLIGLAWRRPFLAALVAIAASAAVETVQAVALVVGRACDTSDLITNAIGAILGGLCAWGALRIRSMRDARKPNTLGHRYGA
jgi:glycopeptide antibiotics resistance protein